MQEQRFWAFIDYENLPSALDVILEQKPEQVYIFFSRNSRKVDIDYVVKLQHSGAIFNCVRIEKGGKNQADLHLTFTMGKAHGVAAPDVEFRVYSNDRDFDQVIRYLYSLGRTCTRMGTAPIAPIPLPSYSGQDVALQRVIQQMNGSRPAKRKGMINLIQATLGSDIRTAEQVLFTLQQMGYFQIDNTGKIIYTNTSFDDDVTADIDSVNAARTVDLAGKDPFVALHTDTMPAATNGSFNNYDEEEENTEQPEVAVITPPVTPVTTPKKRGPKIRSVLPEMAAGLSQPSPENAPPIGDTEKEMLQALWKELAYSPFRTRPRKQSSLQKILNEKSKALTGKRQGEKLLKWLLYNHYYSINAKKGTVDYHFEQVLPKEEIDKIKAAQLPIRPRKAVSEAE